MFKEVNQRPEKPMPVLEIPRESTLGMEDSEKFFTNGSISRDKQWHREHGIHRQSYTELEMDVSVADITNRLLLQERPRKALIDIQDGTQSFGDTKLVPSLVTIWQVGKSCLLAATKYASAIETPTLSRCCRTRNEDANRADWQTMSSHPHQGTNGYRTFHGQMKNE